MSHLPQFRDAIAAAKETLGSLSSLEAQVVEAADLIEQCLRAGNKLLVCGNGGSAADASHFATELVVRFAKHRRAYPAICLPSDGGLLTAAKRQALPSGDAPGARTALQAGAASRVAANSLAGGAPWAHEPRYRGRHDLCAVPVGGARYIMHN